MAKIENEHKLSIFENSKNVNVIKKITISELFNEIKTNNKLVFKGKTYADFKKYKMNCYGYATNNIDKKRSNNNVVSFSPFLSFDIDLNLDIKLNSEEKKKYIFNNNIREKIKPDLTKILNVFSESGIIYGGYRTPSKTGVRLFILINNVPKSIDEYKDIYKKLRSILNYYLNESVELETKYKFTVDNLHDISRLNFYDYDNEAVFTKDELNNLNINISSEYEILPSEYKFKNHNDNDYKIVDEDEIEDFDFDFQEIMNNYKPKLDKFFKDKGYIHHNNGEWFFGAKNTSGKVRNFLRQIYLEYYKGSDSLDNFKTCKAFDKYLSRFKQTYEYNKKWNSIFTGCGIPYLDKYIVIGKKDEIDNIRKTEFIVEKYIDERYEDIERELLSDTKTYVLEAQAGLGKTYFIQKFMRNNKGKYLFLSGKRMLLRQIYKDLKNDDHFKNKLTRNWEKDKNDININEDFLYNDNKKADVYISTFDSFSHIAHFNFDYIFVDEAHLLGRKIPNKKYDFMMNFINKIDVSKIIFISATPRRIFYALNNVDFSTIKINKQKPLKPFLDRKIVNRNDIDDIIKIILRNIIENKKNNKWGTFIFYNHLEKLEKIKSFAKKIDKNIKMKIISSKENNKEIIEKNLLDENTIYLATSTISEGVNINNKLNWNIIYIDREIGDVEALYQLYSRFRKTKPNLFYIKPHYMRESLKKLYNLKNRNNEFLENDEINERYLKSIFNFEFLNNERKDLIRDIIIEKNRKKYFELLKYIDKYLSLQISKENEKEGKNINFYEKISDENEFLKENIIKYERIHNNEHIINNKTINIFSLSEDYYKSRLKYINGYNKLFSIELNNYFVVNISRLKLKEKDNKIRKKSSHDIKQEDFEFLEYKLEKYDEDILNIFEKALTRFLSVDEIFDNDMIWKDSDKDFYRIVFNMILERFKWMKEFLIDKDIKVDKNMLKTAYRNNQKRFMTAFKKEYVKRYFMRWKNEDTDLMKIIWEFKEYIETKNLKTKEIKNHFKNKKWIKENIVEPNDLISVFCKTKRINGIKYKKWDNKKF